uniref:E3 ubiquitin-protein ligase ZNRF1 n=1 Tax=Strix occidentalis caurina TaxID=311401 RepID=A0A8D0F7X9_STROC
GLAAKLCGGTRRPAGLGRLRAGWGDACRRLRGQAARLGLPRGLCSSGAAHGPCSAPPAWLNPTALAFGTLYTTAPSLCCSPRCAVPEGAGCPACLGRGTCPLKRPCPPPPARLAGLSTGPQAPASPILPPDHSRGSDAHPLLSGAGLGARSRRGGGVRCCRLAAPLRPTSVEEALGSRRPRLTLPSAPLPDDVLTKDAGECVICLEELLQGDTIARLPCLCIYHKSCIDSWFEVNRSCPEHPSD